MFPMFPLTSSSMGGKAIRFALMTYWERYQLGTLIVWTREDEGRVERGREENMTLKILKGGE